MLRCESDCLPTDDEQKLCSGPSDAADTIETSDAEMIKLLERLREMGVLDADEFEKKRHGLQADLTALVVVMHVVMHVVP